MLVWSTQIPVIPNRSTDDLLALAKKWLAGSPHSEWQEADFGENPTQDLRTIRAHGQAVAMARFDNAQGSFCGFRHEWQDSEHRNWTTDICGWQTTQAFLVSIQLCCEVTELGAQIPQPKKPYIVRQILDELGGDLDGAFPVSDAPITMAENDLDLAVRVLRGETNSFLPVVYVSSTWRNEPAFDSKELARWASGMAHVVVEPSRRFSFILADRVARTNPYEGAVAICWPHSGAKQVRLFPYDYNSPKDYAAAITDVLRQALAGCRPDHRCTWAYVRELVFAHYLDTLRREGRANIEEYVSAFDAELTATRRELEGAQQEIGRLKAELARNAQTSRASPGPFTLGLEQDLYSGELHDTIVFALGLARDQVLPDGRVQHILDSLLNVNKPTGERDRLQKAIKDAVGGCTNFGTKQRRDLEELGFAITEDGKHLKLVFRGDDRYTFAAPKSGSDWRGMKNWVSDTIKYLFK